jgi:hypothetical protein
LAAQKNLEFFFFGTNMCISTKMAFKNCKLRSFQIKQTLLLDTVDSGYNEPAFSELPAIVNATLGIRMFSHKTNTFFIRL